MTDLDRWLGGLGLEQYAAAFAENAIDMDMLAALTAEDLKEIGVAALGHRKRLLEAIAALRETGGTPAIASPPPPAATTPPGAERRQLTVMFVDLVGSTALSARLDPEEMGAVLRGYQNAVAGEIARFEGHVAKFMGDGVLAYFGWPVAHEDEAERAVRAGLAIVAAVARLSGGEAPLACRIGVATGLVVVGELIGEGVALEQTVVGDTPNLAARLQALAEPGQLVIGEKTRQLLGDLFKLEALEPQVLKGLAGSVSAFAVTGEQMLESRFAARGAGAILPMEGRDQELALLLERWGQAKSAEGQGVLLVGEAGIGKSRITEALIDAVAAEPHARVRMQCSPYHTDSAFWPVIEHLRHAAGFTADDQVSAQLDKLETLVDQGTGNIAGAAPLLAELLGLDGASRYGQLDLTPQAKRARTMQALGDELMALAKRQPVLLVLEDAHWLDPSTLELLQLHLDRCAETRLLIVITSRPDHQPELAAHPHVTRLTLNRLGRAGVAAIVEALSSGATLPTAVIDAIIARTDGVPLFVEEMTKAVLESGTGDALKIPASLHDSLMARLDRLPDVKDVAQAAACIGRVFDYKLLAAVARWPEAELQGALAKLAAAELVFRRGTPPDASYTFKHALVQDAAYESLLRSRRQEIHRQIVLALTEHFPQQASAEPGLLAQHYALAGMAEEAGAAWQEAGQQALSRSAGREAIGHLTRGLGQLSLLPESPERVMRELAAQRLLGTACMNVHGYAAPEVMRAFGRAWELCSLVDADEDAATFPVLFGIWIYQLTRGQHARAAEAAADLLQRVQHVDDQGARIAGHLAQAVSLAHIGRPSEARVHYATGTAMCGSLKQPGQAQRFGLHPGICIHAYQGWCLTTLGYPEQARRSVEKSAASVDGMDHIYTHARRLYWQAVVYQMQGDWPTVRRLAAEAIAVAEEQGYAMVVACGQIMHGAAVAAMGDSDAGIGELREGIGNYRQTGARFQGTYHLALLADALGASGHLQEGHASLDQAFAFMEETGERLCEPDLHRLCGRLLRHQRSDVVAEASLQKALDVARQQNARWPELQTSRDLARLWAERGERQRALDLLAPVYDWFTEGFDTPDLVEAKALLDELR
jgi:class 3 adenylate cyclase/predicted ATPase